MMPLHKDTRGAISVLTLLTIWVSLAVVAMIWNQVEYAQKKQTLQAAADSAAHSAVVWTSRATNAIAAQNMIICQDAAAETIWRACMLADPTETPTPILVNSDGSNYPQTQNQPNQGQPNTTAMDIKGRLARELQLANSLLKNPRDLRSKIVSLLTQTEDEGAQLQQAITTLQADLPNGNYSSPQAATDFAKQVRQAQSAYNWVNDTYMNGAAPTAGRPGPPGPNGEGVVQLIQEWLKGPDVDTQILNLIINYINTVELPIMQGPDGSAPNGRSFETRTLPDVSQPVDAQVAAHEATVYQNQQTMLDGVPDAVEQQRDQFATFYKANITLATPKNGDDSSNTTDASVSSSSATVNAPVVQATDVDPYQGYTDTIRTQYPAEAAAAGLVATFDIDPINPQTADPDTGDARVWHPDVPFTVPTLPNQFTLNANVTGGWGHVWCMPIEKYYNDRVWNDQQTLNTTYMQYLDNARNNRPSDPRDLLYQIKQILGVPTNTTIQPLPGTIPDDQPDDKGVIEQIFVLPSLTAPPKATAQFRTEVDLYNQHAGAYTGDVRSLVAALQNYVGLYSYFTDSFAVNYWTNAVQAARDQVVQDLGENKTFMVLATYKLRFIPEELKGGMNDSATAAIQDQLITNNIYQVTQAILNALIASNPDGVGSGIADKTYRRQVMQAHYSPQASQQAIAAITPIAHNAAVEIAREWLNRPWPYEITPPTEEVPPSRGLGKDDRQQYFTVLAGAEQADGTTPRFLLPKIFNTPPKLVTYSQAETLNWNEYNSSYGGSERFDQVSWIAYNQGFSGIPVPRCWRLSTLGGWAWQPRLSLADAMGLAVQNNPEFQSYMNDAGITGTDQNDFDTVGLH